MADEIKPEDQEVVAQEVETKVDDIEEVKEILTEAIAKGFEANNLAQKNFNLTPNAVNEAELGKVNKWAPTIALFKAMNEGNTPEMFKLHNDRAKTLVEGTTTAGGYLVPVEFELEVLKFMTQYSAVRNNSTVIPMRYNVMNLAELTTDVTVAYTDENTAITESQATFGRPVLTARKIAGLTTFSEELAEDSDSTPVLISLLAERFGRQIAKKEQNELVNGTVSGSQGLLQVSGVTSTTATGSTFASITWDDLANLQAGVFAIDEDEGMDGKFYMSMTPYNALRKLKASTSGEYFLPPVPTADAPAMAWGREIVVCQQFPTSTQTATKYVVYANLKKHLFIGDRAGLKVSFTDSDGSAFRSDVRTMKITRRVAQTTALQAGIGVLTTA